VTRGRCPRAQGFVVKDKRRVSERTRVWNDRARRRIAHHDRSGGGPIRLTVVKDKAWGDV